jgi:putative lipoic acid-binding regulatory protein
VSPGDASADESPLQFPTDYPIKVVGRTERSFRARVDAIVFSHTPDLTEDRVSERASGAGNFTSITYTIVARDRDHVTTLVTALVATEGVLMVI